MVAKSNELETRAILKVKELRVAAGLTTQQLAEKAGVSYNTALAYERDNAEMLRKDVLQRIANALGVSVSALFE